MGQLYRIEPVEREEGQCVMEFLARFDRLPLAQRVRVAKFLRAHFETRYDLTQHELLTIQRETERESGA